MWYALQSRVHHACKQHSWINQANARVIEWVRNSQIPSNPCQWCGSQYKTSNKAHRNACPVLWMCGHLLHKHSTLTPSNQGSLHGYGWQRGVGTSGRGTRQLQEPHESKPGSHSDYLNREPTSPGNACGSDNQEGGRERRAQGTREGLPEVKRQDEPEPATGSEILVGTQGSARLLKEQRSRTEVRRQGLRTASSPAGGLSVGDAPGQPVRHLYEEQEFGSGVHAGLERHSPAPFGREPLEGPQRAGATELESTTSNSALQLVADSHQVQNWRDQEQPCHSRTGCEDGNSGGTSTSPISSGARRRASA